MIKLIASDLDGTLLNDDKELSPDFFEILEELDKRNILFVPSSGRSQFTIGRLFEPYNKNVVYISDNGAYISVIFSCIIRRAFVICPGYH